MSKQTLTDSTVWVQTEQGCQEVSMVSRQRHKLDKALKCVFFTVLDQNLS